MTERHAPSWAIKDPLEGVIEQPPAVTATIDGAESTQKGDGQYFSAAPAPEYSQYPFAFRTIVGMSLTSVVLLPAMVDATATHPQADPKPIVEVTPKIAGLPEAFLLPPPYAELTISPQSPQIEKYTERLWNHEDPDAEIEYAQSIMDKKIATERRFNFLSDLGTIGFSLARTPDDFIEEDYLIQKQIADKYNIHINDPRSYLKTMHDYEMNPATPSSQYVKTLSEFLAKSGSTLRFPNPYIKGEEKLRAPSAELMESVTMKRVMARILKSMAYMPQELTNLASDNQGIDVILVDNNDKDYGGLGWMNNQHKMAIGQFSGEDVVEHEVSHLLDSEMSGGYMAAHNDPEYTALNQGITYQKKGNEALALTAKRFYEGQNGRLRHLSELYINEGPQPCFAQADLYQENEAAFQADVVFVTEYASQENVVEDKAETLLNIIDSSNLLNRDVSEIATVRSKLKLLMHRLAGYAPRLTGFLLERKSKPFMTPSPGYYQSMCAESTK